MTVQDITTTIDTSRFTPAEDITLNEMIDSRTETELSCLLESSCEFSIFQDINRNRVSTYKIDSEDVLNTLRQLYISTKNSFVKNVVKTVGVNKRMTEKSIKVLSIVNDFALQQRVLFKFKNLIIMESIFTNESKYSVKS